MLYIYDVLEKYYDWYMRDNKPTFIPKTKGNTDDVANKIMCPIFYGNVDCGVQVNIKNNGDYEFVSIDKNDVSKRMLSPTSFAHFLNGSGHKATPKDKQFFQKLFLFVPVLEKENRKAAVEQQANWIYMMNEWVEFDPANTKEIKQIIDVVSKINVEKVKAQLDEKVIKQNPYVGFTIEGENPFENNERLYNSYVKFFVYFIEKEKLYRVDNSKEEIDKLVVFKLDNSFISFGMDYGNQKNLFTSPAAPSNILEQAHRFNSYKDFNSCKNDTVKFMKIISVLNYLTEVEYDGFHPEERRFVIISPLLDKNFGDFIEYLPVFKDIKDYSLMYENSFPDEWKEADLYVFEWVKTDKANSMIKNVKVIKTKDLVFNAENFRRFFKGFLDERNMHYFNVGTVTKTFYPSESKAEPKQIKRVIEEKNTQLLNDVLSGRMVSSNLVNNYFTKIVKAITSVDEKSVDNYGDFYKGKKYKLISNMLEVFSCIIEYNQTVEGVDSNMKDFSYLIGEIAALYHIVEELYLRGIEQQNRSTHAEKMFAKLLTQPAETIPLIETKIKHAKEYVKKKERYKYNILLEELGIKMSELSKWKSDEFENCGINIIVGYYTQQKNMNDKFYSKKETVEQEGVGNE